MKKLYFLSTYIALFIITTAALFPVDAPAQGPVTLPTSVSQGGVREIELSAGGGKVKINLPDDMRAGDTISGTVSAEPNGKTETERAKNSAELSGYVVEIAGSQQSPWEKIGNSLKAVIKFALTDGKTPTGVLKSKTGTIISNFNVPVSSLGITMPPTSAPTANDFTLPTIGQQGRPATITGPFDGSFENTVVRVGDQSTRLLAESPRKVVFEVPADVTGDQSTRTLTDLVQKVALEMPAGNVPGVTEIKLQEGNVEKSGNFRNLKLDLTSPKTNLMKGEKTTVTVKVSGLDGITAPVPMQIVTTGGVTTTGGNTQNISIQPSQVQPGGTYTQTFALTATQTGVFNMTATVTTTAKCECKCELNERTPILTAGKNTNKDGSTENSFEPNIKVASCNGNQCAVAGMEYSWTVGAGSTATYKVRPGTDKAKKLIVDVTKSGKLILTVTVTVICSDGTKCTDTGTFTFDVTGSGTGEQTKCECKCQLNDKTPVISAGRSSIKGGGKTFSYSPNVKVAGCNGDKCEVSSITYAWKVGGTATFTVREGSDKAKKLMVDVTGDGTLDITVTVTVTCSDGSTCTDTGTMTIDVKK